MGHGTGAVQVAAGERRYAALPVRGEQAAQAQGGETELVGAIGLAVQISEQMADPGRAMLVRLFDRLSCRLGESLACAGLGRRMSHGFNGGRAAQQAPPA
ncbi:hypothetical protein [Herbaspirillum huttiense]|uniref:hypothetical protein n=1 Tax=Herbaspirillum huttiense TaxID=863372 RepID=UPI0012FF4906|nr:hypothetical protein [Herbaspirillum huttiense]MBN9359031.1 hypothetical protein [Herbaspirillum huttiense]